MPYIHNLPMHEGEEHGHERDQLTTSVSAAPITPT